MSTTKELGSEIDSLMGSAQQMAFVGVIRRNLTASLADVLKIAESRGLGHLTVGQVFFDEKMDKKPLKALPSPGSVNTKTVEARNDYEQKLLDALKGHKKQWLSAQTLRENVGGTPLQARKALNRLIERDLVKYKGNARATKYKIRKRKPAAPVQN